MRSRGWVRGLPVMAAAALLSAPWGAIAQTGGLVLDLQNLAVAQDQKAQYAQQIEQLGRVYAKQLEQLAIAQQQRDAMTGTRGLGALLNGEKERAARRSAPETLQALLQAVGESGQIPSSYSDLRALAERVRREVPLGPVQEVYGPSAQSATGRAYDRSQRTTAANLAVAEKAYQDAARRLATYEQLGDQIDRTADTKASSDLVARLLLENGLAVNELIRLTALSLAADATEQANVLAARGNLAGMTRAPAKTSEKKTGAEQTVPVIREPTFRGVLR